MIYRVPIGRVVVSDEEKRAVMETLDAGQLSPGEKATAFEMQFAEYVCGAYGVLVNSGTDALRIALLAMKEHFRWRDQDEVILPALTFVATANTVLQANLKPVFVDVYPFSHERPFCIDDAYGVGQAITPKTRCILPVHLFGRAAISERSSLQSHINPHVQVLEDSCESLSASLYGAVSCFSFYVCHLISLGVGGMCVTGDKKLEKLIRSYANHGRDPRFLGTCVSDAPRDLSTRFAFERLGYSSRLTEMQAALGLEQLKTIDARLAQRRIHAMALFEKLSVFKDSIGLHPFPDRLWSHSWMMFPVVLTDDSLDRETFCRDLESLGIETRPLMPLLTQPLYKRLFPGEYKKHVNALAYATRGFYIGCHEHMTAGDIDYVCEAFWECLSRQKTAKVAQVA